MKYISVILTIAILILCAVNCVLYIMGGNYALAVIWGIIAVLNIVSIVLKTKQKK